MSEEIKDNNCGPAIFPIFPLLTVTLPSRSMCHRFGMRLVHDNPAKLLASICPECPEEKPGENGSRFENLKA